MLYTHFTLSNGLHVIHHQDTSTQLCVLNLLYKVGAKNENPEHTGFAHLFEHLMFGGSANIPEFDTMLQTAGGESNAFTSNDITNYYITLPANNVETGFWLESDRMLQLDFNQKSLDVQKSVVIEEFKERYLNQPYGDLWLKILPLAYKEHPYQWPTIGKSIDHIEKTTLKEVEDFFAKYYSPANAVLVVAGNIDLEKTQSLCKKWFEPIPYREVPKQVLPFEPPQNEARKLDVYADVPLNLILKAYKMGGRLSEDYYATDLISDILSSGKSSRLYNNLVKEKGLFSELDAYISGDADPGLFLVEGKLMNGVSFETAEKAIEEELSKLVNGEVSEKELQKVINKTETNLRFGNVSVLNRAMKLAYAWFLGDISLANTEAEEYTRVRLENITNTAKSLFRPENCSTIYYHANDPK